MKYPMEPANPYSSGTVHSLKDREYTKQKKAGMRKISLPAFWFYSKRIP